MPEKTGELQPFLQPIEQSAAVAELCHRLTENRHAAATGQWGSCALALAAVVQKKLARPLLVITAHLDEADDAVDQLTFFRPGSDARLYPAFEVLPGESNVSDELAAQRLELLVDLAAGDKPQIVVAPVQSLMQPSPNRDLLKDLVLSLKTGQSIARDALVRWLTEHGYTRLDAVEDAGDFAVRGEIVDVWAPGEAYPVRVDFFGDEIESIHPFDIESLGAVPGGKTGDARLVGLGDRTKWPIEQTTSLLNYLPPDTVVWLIEPSEIQTTVSGGR